MVKFKNLMMLAFLPLYRYYSNDLEVQKKREALLKEIKQEDSKTIKK